MKKWGWVKSGLSKTRDYSFTIYYQAKNFLSVQPTAAGKGKTFFSSNFFNFLAELCHSKTFGEKKCFSKFFQKTLFGNFDHEGGLKSFFNIYQKLFSVKNPRGKVVSDFRYLPKCRR